MRGVILSLYTGLRLGELLALEWSDVDLSRGVLSVNKACYDGKNNEDKFSRIVDEPKTALSKRDIPIPKQLLPMLKEMKKESKCKNVISNNGKVFSVRSYQTNFSLLLKRVEVKHRGFHALRHTFATRALECGMDVKTLSEILGHKNPTMTLNRYAHSMIEHKRDIMNIVGKSFLR